MLVRVIAKSALSGCLQFVDLDQSCKFPKKSFSPLAGRKRCIARKFQGRDNGGDSSLALKYVGTFLRLSSRNTLHQIGPHIRIALLQ